MNTTSALFLINKKHKIHSTLGNKYKVASSLLYSTPSIKKWGKKVKYKATVNNLHVRLSPSTSGKHYRYLHKKTKAINYWGEVTIGGIRWFCYTNVKNQTCYVASNFLKKA